jgi:hypothetical protein
MEVARHLRQAIHGGSSTASSLNEHLSDLTWEQAVTQVYDFNTIAMLVFHIGYYAAAQRKVLEGGPLDAHDDYSFDVPAITNQTEWENLRNETLENLEVLANLIAACSDNQLWENFVLAKYGSNYHNFHGMIEHVYYHLGQMVLIKKMVLAEEDKRE